MGGEASVYVLKKIYKGDTWPKSCWATSTQIGQEQLAMEQLKVFNSGPYPPETFKKDYRRWVNQGEVIRSDLWVIILDEQETNEFGPVCP